MGRRRQRVRRPARGLRRHDRRPQPCRRHRGGAAADRQGLPLRPTEDAIVVAENLAAGFGRPKGRFSNSGTEATMDAVHLMRAITGRGLIVKIEGATTATTTR